MASPPDDPIVGVVKSTRRLPNGELEIELETDDGLKTIRASASEYKRLKIGDE